MTSAENIALAGRTNRAFTFLKNGSTEFFPGSGTRLQYVSKGTDTLTLTDLPAGLLESDDSVTVKYLGETVFVGSVATIVDSHGRGDERVQTVTCEGPWGAMNRLVFRQTWGKGSYTFSSPRVILNQSALGEGMTLTEQVEEICDFAAEACGFTVGDVDVGDIHLPNDETRDMTCASALLRELRFFPKNVVRFDYGVADGPELTIVEPDTDEDADYVDDIPMTARQYEYNAHPIAAVDVYTDGANIVTGEDGVDTTIRNLSHQVYPVNADIDGLDVLHCYMPLAKGTAESSWESLDVTTEHVGTVNGSANWKEWWRTKHPRLHDVANGDLEISENGYPHPSFTPHNITDCTVGALRKFGLHAELVKFHCKAKITTADDVEEDIYLTMDFVVTDASTRTYTQQTGSSSTAGETLPDGLAEAIYRQRAGDLLNETMTIRLGDAFPTLGDCADGLVLQDFSVDCADLTAELHFGQPEHISPEDMRSLLNGFRQRGYASNSVMRGGDDEDAEEEATPVAGIQPVASTEFSPGTKAKTTIKSSSGEGNKVVIDSSKVTDGTMAVRELTIKTESGEEQTLQILATSSATVTGEGKKDEPDDDSEDPSDPCSHPGGGEGVSSGARMEEGEVAPGADGGGGVKAEGPGSDNPSADCCGN